MLLNVKMHQNPSVHCCFFLSVFLTVTFALVLLRFPSSHKVSVRSLDVSDSILNLPLILQRHIDSSMTATLTGKSDLLFFVSKISTGQTGRAFHFAPLPLTPTTISLRVQCDPYRHPTGRIIPLPLPTPPPAPHYICPC